MELFWGKSIDDGKMYHISEVENGLNCNCVCPKCNTRLVAKQGDIQLWHFAHESSINCSFSNESALHLYAKQLLLGIGHIKVPRVRYFDGLEDIDLNYQEHYGNSLVNGEFDLIREIYIVKDVKIDDALVEETIHIPEEASYRADIILICGGKKLVVEIKVTHEVDEYKRKKIIKSNLSALEIDLSGIDLSNDKDSILNILIEDSKRKYWVYNKKANDEIKTNYKKVIYRGKRYPQKSYICPETKKYHNRMCSDCRYAAYYYSGDGFSYNLCSYPKEAKNKFD